MDLRAATATTLALLAAAAIAGCGSDATDKSGAERSARRALRLVIPPPGRAGIDGDFTPIFHGREPFVAGDSYIKWDRLRGGGFDMTFCTIARQEPKRTFRCSRTFILPAGQIVAVGDYDDLPEGDTGGTLPVVGGTGAYEGARGSVRTIAGRRGGTHTLSLP